MDTSLRRALLVGLVACGLLYAASRWAQRIAPLAPSATVRVESGFVPAGEYPVERFPGEGRLRRWGSWHGSDLYQGRLELGPFTAPRVLQFYYSGYPARPGNALALEREGSGDRLPLHVENAGERWQLAVCPLPAEWQGRSVRLVATDGEQGWGGWLAVSEPVARAPATPTALLLEAATAWAVQGLVLGLTLLPLLSWWGRRREKQPPPGWPLSHSLAWTTAIVIGCCALLLLPGSPPLRPGPLGAIPLAILGFLSVLAAWNRIGPSRLPSALAALRGWWREPRVTGWLLLALAALLFLRKPHALLTPQLWAEDGAIFLAFNDLDGLGTLATPYMGYLHTLPRLIAWVPPHFADPVWWPAWYNLAAFAGWLAVIARLFSRRLELPGKPWLALAFLAGPNTGEILFNITNLQWITAFVLIQQALIRRPENLRERLGDLALLALTGLTGPFVIAFAPLFAWRWWRDRHRDNLGVLLLVALCAGLQAWHVYHTGPKFDYQAEPVRLLALLAVVMRRILVWPIFGPTVAQALPSALIGLAGTAALAGFALWVLRPHPRRPLRAAVAGAFVLIGLASVFRMRPDTWAADNLDFGDRYFFIPRVLLYWLLIWEFDSAVRAVAGTARLLGLAILLVHLPGYRLPPPVDLHWARYVEPIRQGVPAKIPILPEGFTMEYRGRNPPTP